MPGVVKDLWTTSHAHMHARTRTRTTNSKQILLRKIAKEEKKLLKNEINKIEER